MGRFVALFCSTIGAAVVGWLLCAAAGSPLAAATDQVDACDVFKQPEQFLGKWTSIRGVFVHHIHGSFLKPYPRCEGVEYPIASIHDTAETIAAWRSGGGRQGLWMLSVMIGKLERNSNGGLEFYIESLKVLQRVDPYPTEGKSAK